VAWHGGYLATVGGLTDRRAGWSSHLWSVGLPGVCGAGRRAAVVAVLVVAPRPWLAVYGRCWIWCQPQAGWTQGTRSGESRCRGTGCRLFPVSPLPCVRVWSGARRTHDGSTASCRWALRYLLSSCSSGSTFQTLTVQPAACLSVMKRERPASVAADVRPPDTGRPAGLGRYAAARHGLRGRIVARMRRGRRQGPSPRPTPPGLWRHPPRSASTGCARISES
jgi:hypothetical protein